MSFGMSLSSYHLIFNGLISHHVDCLNLYGLVQPSNYSFNIWSSIITQLNIDNYCELAKPLKHYFVIIFTLENKFIFK